MRWGRGRQGIESISLLVPFSAWKKGLWEINTKQSINQGFPNTVLGKVMLSKRILWSHVFGKLLYRIPSALRTRGFERFWSRAAWSAVLKPEFSKLTWRYFLHDLQVQEFLFVCVKINWDTISFLSTPGLFYLHTRLLTLFPEVHGGGFLLWVLTAPTNDGVCVCVCVCVHLCTCSVTHSCLILCNPMDCSPPGSSVPALFQASILECIAISFSRGSSQPRDWTCISCASCTGGLILYHYATWEANCLLPNLAL